MILSETAFFLYDSFIVKIECKKKESCGFEGDVVVFGGYNFYDVKKKEMGRQQQDSNLRRQSPTDFESVSLTTRTY